MSVRAICVSGGRSIEWLEASVETGIYKEAVGGRLMVRRRGIEGDRQFDHTAHGGESRAVYAYSAEHYAWWEAELEQRLEPGAFGENLVVESLDEDAVCVGDVLRVGDALLQATEPRMPCFKLGVRFGNPAMVKRFMQSGRFGILFRVVEEGEIGVGDSVSRVSREPSRVPVPALARMMAGLHDPELLARALECEAVTTKWADKLRRRFFEASSK